MSPTSQPAEGPSIVPLTPRHARAAAELHRVGIATGFLSSLGPAFLRQLYAGISRCPAGFGYAAEAPEGSMLGFIACAESTGRLYKQALLRRGVLMALPLLRFLLRPTVIWRMIDTLRYPSRTGDDLPAAEVLSVAVSEAARGKGVGRELMRAALEEFRRRGIGRVRVGVWAGNTTANRYYEALGFHLARTVDHHGLPMNIYVYEPADAGRR